MIKNFAVVEVAFEKLAVGLSYFCSLGNCKAYMHHPHVTKEYGDHNVFSLAASRRPRRQRATNININFFFIYVVLFKMFYFMA